MAQYVVIAAIALAVAAYLYFRTQPPLGKGRRVLLSALRAVTLAIALLLLISPILYFTRHQQIRQRIIVLEDISASMDLKSATTSKSALLNPAGEILKQKFKAAGYEVNSHKFSSGLGKDPSTTLLSPALKELAGKYDFSKVRGIVLLSDGWTRDENLDQARQLGTPFFVIADTTATAAVDIAVTGVRNNRHAYRAEPFLISAEISSQNYTGTATARLILSGRQIATQNVTLKAGEITRADFNQRFNTTGFYPFSVEVAATSAKERSTGNNQHPGAVEVLADKEKIVVLSDKPAWDNKFILDSIAQNNRWQAAHYLFRDGRVFSGENAVSAIAEPNPAAVIVINNGSLPADPILIAYINAAHRKGAGILWQGLPLSELASVLPLRRSNVNSPYQGFLKVLPAAANYPMFSLDEQEQANIPPLDYYYVTLSPGAETIAVMDNAQNSPAIAVSGTSRVICMAFLNLWKWQLQSAGSTYRGIISDSVTWLANRAGAGYNAIYNNSFFLGEEALIKLRAEDDIRQARLDLNPRVKVFDAENKEVISDFMTRDGDEYTFGFTPDKAGQYSFRIGENGSRELVTGRFSVADSPIEDRDFDFNLPLLAWLANESGGKLLPVNFARDFSPLPAQTEKLSLRDEIPLYRKWYLLALFILTFCLELFFRRRWGLL
jgi:hypothetical protein